MHIDLGKLKKEQLKLQRSIVTKDDFEKIDLLGGCDFTCWDKKIGCALVVYDTKEKKIIETQTIVLDETFPYIPTYLFYRYGTAVNEAYLKLQTRPDILMVHGNGRLHPRHLGLASHIGLALDIPTIGVAQKLLCGEVRDGFVYLNDEKIGASLKTREFSNPVFVSVGHRICLKTAVQLVKDNCIEPHKMPEPLHLVHKIVSKLKGETDG